MKSIKAVCMSVLILVVACKDQERSFTEPHRTGTLPETVQPNNNPVYFQTEQDQFNPDSRFESIRKRRLTNFGYRDIIPPISTPTRNTVQQAFIDGGLEDLAATNFKTGKVVFPTFPFDYENDVTRLKQLYSDHLLNTLISEDMTELEQLTALMIYTNRFLEGGTLPEPSDDLGPSAEYITLKRRNDNIGGTSRHYAALYCQLALSLGFNTRLVGMHTIADDGSIISHTVCEVFMNQYEKWVVFDSYSRATYYLRNGIPQSAIELRNIMLDRNYRAIQAYPQIGDITTVDEVKEKLLPCYTYLYIWRMNDILSKSPRNGTISWQELYQTHLVWEDARTLIKDGRFEDVAAFSDTTDERHPLTGVRYVAHEITEFNWPLNYVVLDLEARDSEYVISYFNTVTPNFNEFLIDDKGYIHTKDYSHIVGTLAHDYIVQSINAFGMAGVKSYVDFSW